MLFVAEIELMLITVTESNRTRYILLLATIQLFRVIWKKAQ